MQSSSLFKLLLFPSFLFETYVLYVCYNRLLSMFSILAFISSFIQSSPSLPILSNSVFCACLHGRVPKTVCWKLFHKGHTLITSPKLVWWRNPFNKGKVHGFAHCSKILLFDVDTSQWNHHLPLLCWLWWWCCVNNAVVVVSLQMDCYKRIRYFKIL